MTSPISSPQNIFAIQEMGRSGDPPSWLAWMAVALPVACVGNLACWALLMAVYRPGSDIKEVRRLPDFTVRSPLPSWVNWPAGRCSWRCTGRKATLRRSAACLSSRCAPRRPVRQVGLLGGAHGLGRSGRNIKEVRRLPDSTMALLMALCRPEREIEKIRHLSVFSCVLLVACISNPACWSVLVTDKCPQAQDQGGQRLPDLMVCSTVAI